jgi:hypothetical protein
MAVSTLTVGAGTFTIGAAGALQNFSSQVTSIKLTSSTDTGDSIYVLSGESVAGDYSESYTIEGTMLQDFGTAGSKIEWLLANSGTTQVFEFVPNTVKAKKITGSLVVTPPAEIGGDVKQIASTDFSFNVVGKPTIV